MPENARAIEKVLVVDDNEQNRRVAEARLATEGYAVALAETGEQALVEFERFAPHLVLLDVLMPGLDGFETCRRLRALPGGKDVAIVFLTALADLESHQKAIGSGADDFLSKPIHRTELLMRVRSLLWVKRLKDELRHGYDLIRSQRDAILSVQKQKDECVAFIVHDLKNPLTGVLGNAELLSADPGLSNEARKCVRGIQEAAEAMRRMTTNLLDISRSEDGALLPVLGELEVAALAESAVAPLRRRAEERSQTLAVAVEPPGLRVRADRDLVVRLLENLLDNCLKYGPRGGAVRIEARPAGGHVEVRVGDEGPGVPEAFRERIFEKYARLERDAHIEARTSRGLGLTFCKLAAEVHGGRIWVEENRPQGTVFCVRLPGARA